MNKYFICFLSFIAPFYSIGQINFLSLGKEYFLEIDVNQLKCDDLDAESTKEKIKNFELYHFKNDQYGKLFLKLDSIRDKNDLDQFQYLKLCKDLSCKIFPSDEIRAKLVFWWLIKMSFNTQLLYDDYSIYIFVSSENEFQNIPNFRYEDQIYIDISSWYFKSTSRRNLSLYTPIQHSYLGEILCFSPEKLFDKKIFEKNKEYSFEKGTDLKLKLNFSSDIEYYCEIYPNHNFKNYHFVSNLNRKEILKKFRPILNGRSRDHSISFILRFVQECIISVTDEERFGRDYFQLAEETLYRGEGDCEDKSILFSYLIQEVLGLETIIIEYKGSLTREGHVNVGIISDGTLSTKETFEYKGRKIIICETTGLFDLGEAVDRSDMKIRMHDVNAPFDDCIDY